MTVVPRFDDDVAAGATACCSFLQKESFITGSPHLLKAVDLLSPSLTRSCLQRNERVSPKVLADAREKARATRHKRAGFMG